MFKRVAAFHRLFGQNISDTPTLPNIHERHLRIRLLQEELNEFCDAYRDDDLVEMADGLADICYIIAGTCVSYGICPPGDSYESPYEGVLPQMTMYYNLALDRILREDFDAYLSAEENNDLNAIKDALMQMITSVFGVGLHLGLPLNSLFAEVHRSNLSKVDESGKPRYRADGKLLKGSCYSPPDIKGVLQKAAVTRSTLNREPVQRVSDVHDSRV